MSTQRPSESTIQRKSLEADNIIFYEMSQDSLYSRWAGYRDNPVLVVYSNMCLVFDPNIL